MVTVVRNHIAAHNVQQTLQFAIIAIKRVITEVYADSHTTVLLVQNKIPNGKASTNSRNRGEEEDDYLGHVYFLNDKDSWSEEIFVNDHPITFKLDTGATVNVIGEDMAHSFQIRKSLKNLKGPCDTKLKVVGSFEAQLK